MPSSWTIFWASEKGCFKKHDFLRASFYPILIFLFFPEKFKAREHIGWWKVLPDTNGNVKQYQRYRNAKRTSFSPHKAGTMFLTSRLMCYTVLQFSLFVMLHWSFFPFFAVWISVNFVFCSFPSPSTYSSIHLAHLRAADEIKRIQYKNEKLIGQTIVSPGVWWM